MKKLIPMLLTMTLICALAACGQSSQPSAPSQAASSASSEISAPAESETPTQESSSEEEESASSQSELAPSQAEEPASSQAEFAPEAPAQADGSNILIAYFSVPEDVNPSGVDAIAGASIVVKDGEVQGNVQYMANIIQQTVGGDLFRIETVQQYPLDHDPLVDQAAQEQDDDARPALSTHIESLEQYDTILLGYPNWWGDLPRPLYTFLEEYDFSGKTIIPFCPHGGSGFSRTEDTIAQLQPGAAVSENGLTISRNDVAGAEQQITAWAAGLGL